MEHKIDRKDIRLIAICAVIAAISLLVGSHYFYQAFPEATIDFRITRHESRVGAASFLEQRGFALDEFRHAGVFEFDNQAKTFLERERGLEGASDIIDNPVRLWRWSNRWFRELQKEEYHVQHTTTGDLVGFSHLVEEEATGASLTQPLARRVAEQFLAQMIELDMGSLEFVEAETTQRPNRVDTSSPGSCLASRSPRVPADTGFVSRATSSEVMPSSSRCPNRGNASTTSCAPATRRRGWSPRS